MKKYYEFMESEQESVLKDYYEGCLNCQALGVKYETSQYHIQKILPIFASKDPKEIKKPGGRKGYEKAKVTGRKVIPASG